MKSGTNEIVDVDEVVDGWVRATELYPNPRMIKNGLARDDVKQGRLGKIMISRLKLKVNIFTVQVIAGCWRPCLFSVRRRICSK